MFWMSEDTKDRITLKEAYTSVYQKINENSKGAGEPFQRNSHDTATECHE